MGCGEAAKVGSSGHEMVLDSRDKLKFADLR